MKRALSVPPTPVNGLVIVKFIFAPTMLSEPGTSASGRSVLPEFTVRAGTFIFTEATLMLGTLADALKNLLTSIGTGWSPGGELMVTSTVIFTPTFPVVSAILRVNVAAGGNGMLTPLTDAAP